MQCPNCDGSVEFDTKECPHCGAHLAPRRVFLGRKQEEFSLTPEGESYELGDYSETEEWQLGRERVVELLDQTEADKPPQKEPLEWGGFWRRASAFVVDACVILLLAAVMFTLSYIGYKVGLSAHGKSLTWQNATALLVLLCGGGIVLSGAYFVFFHAMDGQTIGKRLLGLRVVGFEQAAVTFFQALVRWLAAAGFAPICLGFFWVLWSREKRAWHDLLARTWVIRERSHSQPVT